MESLAATVGIWLICAVLIAGMILCRCARRRNRRHGSILPARFWRRMLHFGQNSGCTTCAGGRCTGERDEG